MLKNKNVFVFRRNYFYFVCDLILIRTETIGYQYHIFSDGNVEDHLLYNDAMKWLVLSRGHNVPVNREINHEQDQYTLVLETRLLPQLEVWFPNHEEYISMHASTSSQTQDFLVEKLLPLYLGTRTT